MAGFGKKNIEYTQRNGNSRESSSVIRYITQTGRNGNDGADAYIAYITPQTHVFTAGPVYANDNQSDRIIPLAFRGGIQLDTYVVPEHISGAAPGLTFTVHNNGTNQTYIDVSVSSTLEVDGSLNIPIQYNVDVTDSSIAYDASIWDSSIYTIATTNAVYSWTLAKSGESMYVLDLSNENASINADASGNILTGAMRPSCTATLNFGASPVSGAKYSISYPSNYGVQGVSINQNTGVLTFNSGSSSTPFRFGDVNDPNDTVLEIKIDASYNGTVRGSKVMTITKVLPGGQGITPHIGSNGNWWIGDSDTGIPATGDDGDTPYIGSNGNWWIGGVDTGIHAEGQDAVSYWLDFSADVIRVNKSGTCVPSSITATAYKQIGGETPTTATDCSIWWDYNTTNPTANKVNYTYTINDVNASKDYITFKLYKGGTSTFLGETETVPILKDGKDGSTGGVGPRGPVIRGPIEWDPTVARRYCAGAQNGSDSASHPEDASYIDIVRKDGSLYQCIKSFAQTSGAAWKGSSYWQVADAEYNFVATKLLLATNAKIDFLTGNEFYLTDPSGNIHGGGRARGNGSDVIFWAGAANGSTNINEAPFQVDYNGNIKATSGTFSGFVQYPYKDVLELTSVPTFNKNNITRYGTYTFSASTQYANLVSRTIHHNLGYAVPFTRKLVLPFPTEDLNGFTYNILVSMYDYSNSYVSGSTDASVCDNACLHISVNDTGHQNDNRLYIDNYAFPEIWQCKKWTIEFGSATITCVPYYGNVSDGQASTTVGYRWTITQASGIVTADTEGNDVNTRYKHFTSLAGRSEGAVKPIYELYTYTGTRPSPTIEENIMFVSKSS